MAIKTIEWKNNTVKLIDQTKLPNQFEHIICRDVKTLWHAIKRLSVRGAPALGVSAAFGILLGAESFKGSNKKKFITHVVKTADYIATSRPTAVNLFHGIALMKEILKIHQDKTIPQIKKELKKAAMDLYALDQKTCRAMGRHGAKLIKNGMNVLTVCNAGALATVDYGTALGVMYAAKEAKKKFQAFACETRPLLQGARLTAWELTRNNIDTTLICDNMAATLMQQGKIDIIFTGADRIAANGDAANKIGTYMLAVLAHYHKVPFYVVAPETTFDMAIKSGKNIPIEERKREEVAEFRGVVTAPKKVKVYNPAFDVTPGKLITGIVTEYGIIKKPNLQKVKKVIRA